MHPFRKLSVWQKAHELALATYRATDGVSHRRYPGLADQLRRAVISVPANIAEGTGRDTALQLCHFLEIAIASAREVDYLLTLAADLEAIPRSDHAKLEARTDQVCRMLVALRATVRKRAIQQKETTRASSKTTNKHEGREKKPVSATRRADTPVPRPPSPVSMQ
ncbi:MAG: four helix bundle protein [Gemmatimonadaceae bacterium]|nr:four helix bundle protein [Gemmatimonadaceae bacterium]